MQRIKDLKAGDTFKYGKFEWIKLDETEGGVLAITKDILPDTRKFVDDTNDYRKSEIRKWLNENFLNALIDNGAKEEDFLLFERDLTANDGMRKYKSCVDTISLITCEEYRKYKDVIPTISNRWWTATPYSCLEDYSYSVRIVYTDGSLNWSNAYYGNNGVRPLCCLKPDTLVEETTTSIDKNTNNDKGKIK